MILSSVLVCAINTLTIHTLLKRKRTIFYCSNAFILTTLFVTFIAVLIQKFITDPVILRYISFIAFFYIIYIHLVFHESILKKIFTMFTIWMFSSIILNLVISVAEILSANVSELYIQNLLFIIRIFIQVLLLPATYFWLSKPYKKVLGIVPDKTISFMSLYPVISFLLLVSNYTTTFGYFRNFNSQYDMLLFLFFISLGYVFVFTGINSSSKVLSLRYKYKIVENQVELQRQNYKTLYESTEKLNAMQHDFRHHISAIKTMIDEKKYKHALGYIEQFNQNNFSKTLPKLCANFTADSIIKYYMSLAIGKNISFKTDLHIPEDTKINPLDLCVILGNCLENAIDACEKLSDETIKYIQLKSEIVGKYIIIDITNSFNGKIVKVDNVIKSSKDQHSNDLYGIGLSSISETVKKYNGNVDIKYTNDKFEITIIIYAL
jgi:two-component system sensor histidine kinase AgrC